MSAASPIPEGKLRDAMTSRGLGVVSLARKAGVGVNTVSRALAGRPISLETRQRIAAVLAQHEVDPAVELVLEKLA